MPIHLKQHVKLRSWQENALHLWMQDRKGIASVVTGGGKTVFSLACAAAGANLGFFDKILVLVPSVALLDQWYAVIPAILDVRKEEIGRLGGGYTTVREAVNISVMATAARRIWSRAEIEQTLVIVDECHHMGTAVNRQFFRHDLISSLGLSATPERQYDSLLQEYVIPAVGPVFYMYGLQEALADGVVSKYESYNVKIPLTTEEAEAIASATRSIGRAIASKDQEKLKSLLIRRQKLSNQAKFRLTAVEPVLSLLKLTRGLLFVDTIETCDELAGRLNSAGYRVRPYHSKLTAVTRSANLQLYHSGQLDMLVTCAALDEGFDAPSTQFVFLVASTRSDRRRIQRIGRALRPAPGKSLATAVSFYATDFEQAALAEAEEKLGADATKWMEAKIS